MLTDYLDFSHETSIHQPTSAQYSEPTSDINSFFVRRKMVRPKKVSLFKFEASSTGLSLNDFYRDVRNNGPVDFLVDSPEDPLPPSAAVIISGSSLVVSPFMIAAR